MTNESLRCTGLLGAALLTASVLLAAPAQAALPGTGRTAAFEKKYLTFIIDHHFSALRMTELAAGTDTVREPHLLRILVRHLPRQALKK